MRTLTRILASSAAALAVLSTTPARAQKDIHPQLPNALLLLDNSGSMEFLMNPAGKLPGDPAAPGTACNGMTGLAATNRWANLVTVLTGSIANADFSCQALDRHSAAFTSEFSENGVKPYDQNYYLPFNRIFSNGCTYGAGTLDPNWDWWNLPAADGIHQSSQWRDISGNVLLPSPGGVNPACNFKQAGDGLLDAFRGLVRFGMMTLDSFPNPGTGSTAVGNAATATSVYTTAMQGMWSYFHNWIQGPPPAPVVVAQPPPTPIGGCGAGNPAGCATANFFEVGARNQAAPPWEGRLVPFGDWTSDAHVPVTNDQIQLELLSSRPYGATPIAAMLDDANEFLFGDTTTVPGQVYRFGPSDDQYWINGCRKTFVILMSDGQPNSDMRARAIGNTPCVTSADCQAGAVCYQSKCAYNGCDGSGAPPGNCPYKLPEDIATALRVNPPPSQSVLTFVVGFTISTIATLAPNPLPPSGAVTCDLLTPADCAAPAPQLLACCELQKIAVAGGTSHAYFADNPAKLKTALSGILSQIIQGTTDRTSPVFAPGGNRPAQGMALQATPSAEYQFVATFNVTSAAPPGGGAIVGNISGGPWTGSLFRERYACVNGIPTPQDPTSAAGASLGDDYALNVDNANAANPRTFFTAIGNPDALIPANIDSGYTMRPNIGPTNDGFGTYTPNNAAPASPQASGTFPDSMKAYPAAFGLPSAQTCQNAFGIADSNATQCTRDIVNWEIGGDNALGPDATFQTRDYTQCPMGCPQGPTGCPCRQLGAIFHSTPAVVGPPSEFLRDDTYTTYATTLKVAAQETMLYTATMDGQLHAFKVQAGNTSPDSFYTDHLANNERWSFFPPHVLPQLLPNYNVGGVPLLDGAPVIADVAGQVYDIANGDTPVLQRVGVSPVGWHRVLVASGGSAGGFYYALEITDPENPHFLWQVSTDVIGTPIFGSSTPTPAIATVSVSIPAGGPPIQLPIAILPGGATGAVINACDVSLQSIPAAWSDIAVNDGSNPHLLPAVIPAPPNLRCWDMTKNASRATGNSLTIVRLDTGQVLAHFVGQGYSGAPHNDGNNGGNNGHGGDDNNVKEAINPNVYDAPFRAPLSGTPVPFPGLTGQVSDRVYVGDADGLLWRIDMSDPNIGNWQNNIRQAWDAYIDDAGATREALGPPPIISRDAIGNPVILLATGDQDTFSVQPSSNHVWSLTENPTTQAISPNWHILMPASGARITGPMSLFNGALYFASFLPQAANVCSDGYGSVWAVDYVRRGGPNVAAGGTPALMNPVNGVWPAAAFPSVPAGSVIYGVDGALGTIVMGVSVSETPTCDSSVASPDPYFGSHTSVASATGSSYQVSWQTGGGQGLKLAGTAVQNDANVKALQSVQPPTPGRGTRIDSWASIVE